MTKKDAVPLTDEQIRDIENDQAKLPGATRDNLTVRTVRSALIAQHGFCSDEDQCTCAREIGYRVCQPSTRTAEQADAVRADTQGKLILNGELVNIGVDESGIGDMELIVGTRGVLLSGLSIDETKALAPLLFQAVKLIVARASSTGDQA